MTMRGHTGDGQGRRGGQGRDASEDQSEHIDHSVQLPRGLPIINEFRASHGDLKIEYHDDGSVRYAQAHVQNVMNWLWERGTLDDQHLHDGQIYEQWQMIHQASQGLRHKVTASRVATDGEDLRQRGFTLLLIRIPTRHQRWIDHAIHGPASDGQARFLAQRNCRFYREAFDCLSGRLPPIMEELKQLRENKAKAGE